MTAVKVRGIDVSHHNGTINWADKRRTQGISFGMAKCTQGIAFYDPQYLANREGCHLAGMPFIAYCYAEPGSSSALAQAKNFVAKATKGGTVEGFCLDLEISTLNQPETNAWMRAFGDDLRSLAPDVPTYAYLGGYAANGSGQGSVGHFDHWMYPHYLMGAWPSLYTPRVGGNTTGWAVPPAPSIWQCSDNIGGTDADVSPLSLAELFSGDNVSTPLTQADAELVADAVLARATIASSRVGDPNTPPGEVHSLATWISAIDAGVFATNKNLTPDAIAAAVVAALPPAQSGGLTKQDVTDAVKAVFAQAGA